MTTNPVDRLPATIEMAGSTGGSGCGVDGPTVLEKMRAEVAP